MCVMRFLFVCMCNFLLGLCMYLWGVVVVFVWGGGGGFRPDIYPGGNWKRF